MDLTPFAVRVPATSANLGPGFDALGVALGIHNTVHVEPAARVAVEVDGEGRGELETGPANLVYRAFVVAAQRLGGAPPPLRLRCTNAIPLARGLGSSSAAIVAGLLIADRVFPDRLGRAELLRLAVEVEGHPDNVTPALLGGVQVCVRAEREVLHAAVTLPRPLRAVLFIPDLPISTEAARRVLPATVPLADAVYNLGRAALLVAALAAGDYRLLAEATRDRLHQPARTPLLPAMPALFDAALEAGALGACLSGAGSSLIAFADGTEQAVAAAFEGAAARQGVPGRTCVTTVGVAGAEVVV
jgi:homoserine kinase